MAIKIKKASFGGNGGGAFEMQVVEKLSLRTGKYVDQIKINGKQHGGNGGGDRGEIVLSEDEFINKVEIRSGSLIDFVKLTTNKGRTIEGGGSGGGAHTLENVRVLAIGGRSGSLIDSLTFFYIEDYDVAAVETPEEAMDQLKQAAQFK